MKEQELGNCLRGCCNTMQLPANSCASSLMTSLFCMHQWTKALSFFTTNVPAGKLSIYVLCVSLALCIGVVRSFRKMKVEKDKLILTVGIKKVAANRKTKI